MVIANQTKSHFVTHSVVLAGEAELRFDFVDLNSLAAELLVGCGNV
jgi:hypothetical protein